jgi:Ser/Thr protein kinase RdoA (MazF antagonist)
MTDTYQQIREQVLRAFPGLEASSIQVLGNGLINQTFLVTTESERFVLQRLAPIFPPEVNLNIAAVTRALAAAGVATPRLVPARDGRLWLDLGAGGIWRVQTYVAGHGFDRVQRRPQAQQHALRWQGWA